MSASDFAADKLVGREGLTVKAFFAFFGGVILPAAALIFEMADGMAAEFFDPIPSLWHLLAIVGVGVANALALVCLQGAPVRWLRDDWVLPLLAWASGVAAFYALAFIKVTPFAVIGIIIVGLGLLPLSPLISFMVAALTSRQLARRCRSEGRAVPARIPWFVAGIALMLVLEIPGLVQAWGLREMNSPRPERQARALSALRWVGEERLVRACYFRDDDMRRTVYGALFGSLERDRVETAFYRVTGRSYQSVPRPMRGRFWGDESRWGTNWSWDGVQGGTEVGEKQPGLLLQQSRLEGYANSDTAVGYLEWTMVFQNNSELQQREARALVQLPPGAVVSRLTLWIDGEEREAAFGSSGEVRQAYQAVVSRRRDPVLVTMKGPDRVLVQCFPVQPRGLMKIRFGISVPLLVEGPPAARLALPQLLARNFDFSPVLTHAVWLESNRPLQLPSLGATDVPAGKLAFAVQAAIPPDRFAAAPVTAVLERDSSATLSWVPDPRDPRRAIRQQPVRSVPAQGPLTIVIDGSANMAAAADGLARMLASKGESARVRLLVAGDEVKKFSEGTATAAASWLRRQEFIGGQDATRALEIAIAETRENGGNILWVHGLQPLSWIDSGSLEQALARRRGQLKLHVLSAVPGTNVVLDKISTSIRPVPGFRAGSLAEDLARIWTQIHEGRVAFVRDVIDRENLPEGVTEASPHLGRLWAAEEVERLVSAGPARRSEALALAIRMQLVTSISGAVVLETKQQYDAAGLKPVDPATVPSVPERASTLLLLTAGLVMLALVARSRGQRSGASCAAARLVSERQ